MVFRCLYRGPPIYDGNCHLEIVRVIEELKGLQCRTHLKPFSSLWPKIPRSPMLRHMESPPTSRCLHDKGGCQNYGPFLGTLDIRCRIIIGIQKGTIVLRTTHKISSTQSPPCVGKIGCVCQFYTEADKQGMGGMDPCDYPHVSKSLNPYYPPELPHSSPLYNPFKEFRLWLNWFPILFPITHCFVGE